MDILYHVLLDYPTYTPLNVRRLTGLAPKNKWPAAPTEVLECYRNLVQKLKIPACKIIVGKGGANQILPIPSMVVNLPSSSHI